MRKLAFFAVAGLAAGCTGILGSFEVSSEGPTGADGSNGDAIANGDGSNPDGSSLDAGDAAGPPPKGDFAFTGLATQAGIHDGTSVVDAQGNIYVTTNSTSPLTINGVTHTPNAGGIVLVVIKLDPTGQTVLWSVSYKSDAYIYVNAMDTDAAGNLYLATGMQGATATFGAYTITNPNNDASQLGGLVVSLKAQDGSTRWAMTPDFASTTADQCFGISARGPAGEVAITCTYTGTIRFEPISGNYLNAVANGTGADSVVAMLDTGSGRAIWMKNITGSAYDRVRGLARDAAGNVYIQGAGASPSITDGTYTLNRPSGATVMAYMLKVDEAAPHAISLGKAFGSSSGNVQDGQVAALADGTVVSCFGWDGTIDFGKGPITSAGTGANQDAVAIGIDGKTAATSWVLPWGGVYREDCLGIAADTEGYAVIASQRASASVSIGGKALIDPPPRDGSGSVTGDAIKIDAKGNVAWAYSIKSTDTGAYEAVSSVSIMPVTNRVVYSGLYRGHADLGSGQLTTSENNGTVNSFYVTARSR